MFNTECIYSSFILSCTISILRILSFVHCQALVYANNNSSGDLDKNFVLISLQPVDGPITRLAAILLLALENC